MVPVWGVGDGPQWCSGLGSLLEMLDCSARCFDVELCSPALWGSCGLMVLFRRLFEVWERQP